MSNSQNILRKIELLRKKLTDIALSKGFTSAESLSLSQELDQLLNFYERIQGTERKKILK